MDINKRVAAATLVWAFCSGHALASDFLVVISNFTFSPAEITIRAGDTVTVRNDDDIPHLVIAKDGAFKTKVLDTGNTATVPFKTAGEFPYFCGLHPHMLGKVVVAP